MQSPQFQATSAGIRGVCPTRTSPSPKLPNSNPGPNLWRTDTARGRGNQGRTRTIQLRRGSNRRIWQRVFLDLVLFGAGFWFAVSHGNCVRHSKFMFCSLSLSPALRFDLSEKWQFFLLSKCLTLQMNNSQKLFMNLPHSCT